MELIPLWGRPEWKRRPLNFICHTATAAVAVVGRGGGREGGREGGEGDHKITNNSQIRLYKRHIGVPHPCKGGSLKSPPSRWVRS